MSAKILRFNSTFQVTWQAHCIHRREPKQQPTRDWPRQTISSVEFNGLCKEAMQCLREPKDTNALLESVWVRLCYWLGVEANQLLLPKLYEHRTTAYLQGISNLLQAKLCDQGQEDQRKMRLALNTAKQVA